MQLSPQQAAAYDEIMAWYEDVSKKPKGEPYIGQRKVMAGFAGTGKTTMAKKLTTVIEKIHFCAFTGKAAEVLRSKGCTPAATIHNLLYCFTGISNKTAKPCFGFNANSIIADMNLLIVDEYSMLSAKLIEDLESFGVPILYLGDPFQLPPVAGHCDLQHDIMLTEVHRQALDSPILRAATDVRLGKKLSFGDFGDFKYLPQKKTDPQMFFDADQVIVGRNDTRRKWNKRFRQRLGFDGWPKKGERLICLKNNWEVGLFNGMVGTARSDAVQTHIGTTINIEFEAFDTREAWIGDFMGIKAGPFHDDNEYDRFDFGSVITAHKSQGSEFDKVLVLNEAFGRTTEERARWRYTSLTRARQQCILVEPS